ncbi:hypothetical protein BJ322DRAFT_1083043 [Thelephora terrestris]|uniref:Uncharacterized protein n=1 Tax=Thelephora terrestris TaxID=56493 RepID=A0A9P6H6C9_9AGAM|nr:hypothetical protein BJ322DRAFT_1083043 [Thelephora terrestris]
MAAVPLMLQAALLLLGCALSRYLWGVSTLVAFVVLGFTSIGVLFYLFIVVAGAIYENCPYQTPGSRALRYLGQRVPDIIRSPYSFAAAFKVIFGKSQVRALFTKSAERCRSWWIGVKIIYFSGILLFAVPFAFAFDVSLLGRDGAQKLTLLLRRTHAATEQDDQPDMADLRCISWTLHTSLDDDIHLLTFEHLATKMELTTFDPTLVADPCFDVLRRCISISNRKMATMRGKELLATVSARCFLRSFHGLHVMNPPPRVLADICRRYKRTFPRDLDHTGLPFSSTMTMNNYLADQVCGLELIDLNAHRPFIQEHIIYAHHMVRAAQEKYRQTQGEKVPRWALRFALLSLSLCPPSPVSVVADCLAIVAIDLGCDVLGFVALKEGERLEQISNLIKQTLETMIEAPNPSKYKAISTLFLYAASLGRDGQQGMFDVTLRAVAASLSPMWKHAEPYIAALFEESSPPSLNLVIVLISPHIFDISYFSGGPSVARWADAVLQVPYTDEVGRSVVDATLQIASIVSLRRHIRIEVWALFKKRPSLPPVCKGRSMGTNQGIISHIQGLKDFEILKSYFLLVWSEWESPSPSSLQAMEISIRENFSGTGSWRQREDLVQGLDHVLGELGRGPDYLMRHTTRVIDAPGILARKKKYKKLKDVLLKVERKAVMEIITRSEGYRSTCALPLL